MKEQFSIRIESQAKTKINEVAKKNSRTLSGQIEYLILKAIEDYEKVNGKLEVTNK